MNAERSFDRKLMGFMNRRCSLAKTIAAALACIAIGAVAALAVCGQVFAPGGQTEVLVNTDSHDFAVESASIATAPPATDIGPGD